MCSNNESILSRSKRAKTNQNLFVMKELQNIIITQVPVFKVLFYFETKKCNQPRKKLTRVSTFNCRFYNK